MECSGVRYESQLIQIEEQVPKIEESRWSARHGGEASLNKTVPLEIQRTETARRVYVARSVTSFLRRAVRKINFIAAAPLEKERRARAALQLY